MKKLILLFLTYSLLSLPIFGIANYFSPTDAGTSARMIRLGNIEGLTDQASVIFENPAALYRIKNFSASIFKTTFVNGEVNYLNAALAMRTSIGVFGAGIMTAGVQDIPKVNALPINSLGNIDTTTIGDDTNINGYFNYANYIGKLAYSFAQNKNLSFGISGNGYMTTLDNYVGIGYNIDAGVILDIAPFKLSFVMKNIIANCDVNYSNNDIVTYNSKEKLAAQNVFGIQYSLGEFQLYGQFKQLNNNQYMTKACGINYRPNFAKFFNISAGYKEYLSLNTIKNSTAVGVGLDLIGVSFDYAFEKSEDNYLDNKHYYSIALSF